MSYSSPERFEYTLGANKTVDALLLLVDQMEIERNEARQELAKLKEGLSKVLLKWPASSCPECGEGYSATLLSEEIERLLR